MGFRWQQEPPYPEDERDVERYCSRLIEALIAELGDRLVAVLLAGSWARGEARPPESDLDVQVVIDTVDDAALVALERAWVQSGMGAANIYGLDEIPLMGRTAQEMYTTNAVVLYGTNPFTPPSRHDFAADLVAVAEQVARNARIARVNEFTRRWFRVAAAAPSEPGSV